MEAPNYILLALISIIAYFLRDLHSRLKDTIKDKDDIHDKVVRIESKVQRLDEKMPSEIANLEKLMELQFKQFSEQINELKRAIVHAENTMKQQGEAYIKLFENMTK